MIKLNYLLLLLLAGFAFLQGCETERDPCLEPRITLLRAGAYQRVSDTSAAVIDTALPAPLFIALTSFTNSNVFLQTSNRNKFSFQMSDLADSCQWILRPDTLSPVQDTLTFYYQRQLKFLSNACGYTYYYNLQKVTSTRNAIDSVQLNSSDVNSNASVENVKIFF